MGSLLVAQTRAGERRPKSELPRAHGAVELVERRIDAGLSRVLPLRKPSMRFRVTDLVRRLMPDDRHHVVPDGALLGGVFEGILHALAGLFFEGVEPAYRHMGAPRGTGHPAPALERLGDGHGEEGGAGRHTAHHEVRRHAPEKRQYFGDGPARQIVGVGDKYFVRVEQRRATRVGGEGAFCLSVRHEQELLQRRPQRGAAVAGRVRAGPAQDGRGGADRRGVQGPNRDGAVDHPRYEFRERGGRLFRRVTAAVGRVRAEPLRRRDGVPDDLRRHRPGGRPIGVLPGSGRAANRQEDEGERTGEHVRCLLGLWGGSTLSLRGS
mmetsp:Transcript_34810/g.68517  ORF Transcript_34810/g.68517 Transcript_34810/m.68517 type:complete len:323 (-) Transcript_34810:47-1015(-)